MGLSPIELTLAAQSNGTSLWTHVSRMATDDTPDVAEARKLRLWSRQLFRTAPILIHQIKATQSVTTATSPTLLSLLARPDEFNGVRWIARCNRVGWGLIPDRHLDSDVEQAYETIPYLPKFVTMATFDKVGAASSLHTFSTFIIASF